MNEPALHDLASFDSISDEISLKSLLLIFLKRELCECELMVALNEIQPRLAENLSELEKNGFVKSFNRGIWLFYKISATLDHQTMKGMQNTISTDPGFLKLELERLASMDCKPYQHENCV